MEQKYVVLPDDLILVNIVLNMLEYSVVKILSFVSKDTIFKVCNYLLSKINEKYFLDLSNTGLSEIDIISLYEKLEKDDLNFNFANWACFRGNIPLLNRLLEINISTSREHEEMLLPDQKGLILSIKNNKLSSLIWIIEKLNRYLSNEDNSLKKIYFSEKNGVFSKMYLTYTEVNIAARYGCIEILEWMFNNINILSIDGNIYPLFPTQDGINFAVENGHVLVLEWMWNKSKNVTTGNGPIMLLPDQEHINLAAQKGHQKMLEWVWNMTNNNNIVPLLPDQTGINYTAAAGQLSILMWIEQIIDDYINKKSSKTVDSSLQWLVNLSSTQIKIDKYPTQLGIDFALRNGHFDVVKWIFKKTGIYPNGDIYEFAIKSNNLKMIKWLIKKLKIYPSEHNIEFAACLGKLEILEYIESLSNEISLQECTLPFKMIYPRKDFLTKHILIFELNLPKFDDTKVLEWVSKKIRKYPTMNTIKKIIEYGRINQLKWIAKKTGIYPDNIGISKAVNENKIEILKWIAEKTDKYPSQEDIDTATIYKSWDVIKWMIKEKKMYPDISYHENFFRYGPVDIIELLIDEGYEITPERLIFAAAHGQLEMLKLIYSRTGLFPCQQSVNFAAGAGHINILKWVDSFNESKEFQGKGIKTLYPDNIGITLASETGQLTVIKWIARKTGLLPTRKDINNAVNSRYINLVKWAVRRGIYPTEKYVNMLHYENRSDMVYLISRLTGMSPSEIK